MSRKHSSSWEQQHSEGNGSFTGDSARPRLPRFRFGKRSPADPRGESGVRIHPSHEETAPSSRKTLRNRIASPALLVFALVISLPMLERILYPTIFLDDVIRVVRLIERPMPGLLFAPFYEHVAPLFELVTWITWQIIGRKLEFVALGFSVASVLPWALALILLDRWLVRETGSRTASLIVVAAVAMSPLAMQTAWFFSASSFSWALAGILIALIGVCGMSQRPARSLVWIMVGTAMAPAGTSLGLLATPLAILRGFVDRKASRRAKVLMTVAAVVGLCSYAGACRLAQVDLLSPIRGQHGGLRDAMTGAQLSNSGKMDILFGLKYAITLPAQLLLPSSLGLPSSWCATAQPSGFGWAAGILLLLALTALAIWAGAKWNRNLLIVGAGMIYLGYAMAFIARAGDVKNEPTARFVYFICSRYHVLPLFGLAAVSCALLAALRPVRRCDIRPGLSAVLGSLVGLLLLAIHYPELVDNWSFYMDHPDQCRTLSALQRVGSVARDEGLTRAQLVRISAPIARRWCAGILPNRPMGFPLMMLVEAPNETATPRTDEEARGLLRDRLTPPERAALGSAACAPFGPGLPGGDARTLAVAKLAGLNQIQETRPGHYRRPLAPGSMVFQFDRTSDARFLVLPGLVTDQDLAIHFCDPTGCWRPALSFYWLHAQKPDGAAVVDLSTMIHLWGRPITQMAIHLSQPGEIVLEGPPRLLR